MSIQRIDSDTTHGWQARWPVDGQRGNGLTMLCSDGVHGGPDKAHRAARAAERLLKLQAQQLRRSVLLAELQHLVPKGGAQS
jgi:hypothetical protein